MNACDPEIHIQGPCFTRGGWNWNTSQLDATVSLHNSSPNNQNPDAAHNTNEQEMPVLDRLLPNSARFNPAQTSRPGGQDHAIANSPNVTAVSNAERYNW